jgi:AraC-like DNA-binding protein
VCRALADAIRAYTDGRAGPSPYATEIDGLIILRASSDKPPAQFIMKPSLCVVAQGAKWTSFGDQRFDYQAGQALIVGVEMPSVGRITAGSEDKPFLGAAIEIDRTIMREVLEGLETPPRPVKDCGHAVLVADFEGPLEECVLRLIRLLERPEAIPTLAPMILREMCYWMLAGPQGPEVVRVTLGQGHSTRMIGAIQLLRSRFKDQVRVEELASTAQMSASAFHRHFRAMTSMTPLQYQKQLRLLEARRLMVSESSKVETAAFAVGYESPSQFSREYARTFGAPPKRDTMHMSSLPIMA